MNWSGALILNPAEEAARICARIPEFLQQLRRRGAVIGISGGVDSAVVAALCARALGKDRVLGLLMPEADSSPDSTRFGLLLASSLIIPAELEDVTPILEAAGCYQRRDAAIRAVIPEYGTDFRCKIVLHDGAYRVFWVVVQSPEGVETRARLPLDAYLAIVAATNFKQRTRKMMEYHHADRLNYAVAGTPNRLEYDQGFFVKHGDGAADFKPIAHLFKSQVYQLGEYLGVPAEILERQPSTDTYSLEQSQDEFYFSLPYRRMDLALLARDLGICAEDAAAELGLTAEETRRAYAAIDAKRKAAKYLHLPPLTML
jgi:NAD+ synthase